MFWNLVPNKVPKHPSETDRWKHSFAFCFSHETIQNRTKPYKTAKPAETSPKPYKTKQNAARAAETTTKYIKPYKTGAHPGSKLRGFGGGLLNQAPTQVLN